MFETLPKIKTKHEDIITTEEWQHILDLAADLDFSQAWQVPPYQYWLQCVLAFDWLFGKRITEILRVRRKHITFTNKLIKVLFFVGKKERRGSPIELLPYQKVKTIKHKAMPYIKAYLEEYDKQTQSQEGYLFPANTDARHIKVKTKFINKAGEEETRQYEYEQEGGFVRRETASAWLQKINQQLPPHKRIWFHYGRHTIGIKEARDGKSDIQIAAILDTTPRAALEYTKRAGGYTDDWTQKED